jgi:hypothetical protein
LCVNLCVNRNAWVEGGSEALRRSSWSAIETYLSSRCSRAGRPSAAQEIPRNYGRLRRLQQ